jgi:hypothetical protein
MSLLTPNTPTLPTNAEKLANISNRIKSISTRTYNDLVRVQKNGIDAVWKDREFTPQQIVDALGDDAVKIFDFHSGLTQYLVTVSTLDGVDYTPALPTHAFTINNGKITITDQPYVL